jgi:hypothetical protein
VCHPWPRAIADFRDKGIDRCKRDEIAGALPCAPTNPPFFIPFNLTTIHPKTTPIGGLASVWNVVLRLGFVGGLISGIAPIATGASPVECFEAILITDKAPMPRFVGDALLIIERKR